MTFAAGVVGHEHAKRLLHAALMSRQVAHAYLFVGARGVGKYATALAFAQALLCQDASSAGSDSGCGECSACRLCLRGGHPDLHVVAPDGQFIKIEQIRDLQERLSLRSFYGGAKVAILDDADRLGDEAAAAFLKTLEEPPEGTHFLLVCHNLASLVLTIPSRCQVIRFGTLSTEHVIELVGRQRQIDPEACRLLAAMAEGRPGQALAADVERQLEHRQIALSFLRHGLSGNALNCFDVIEGLTRGRKRQEVLEFVEILTLVVRDLLLMSCARDATDSAVHLDTFLANADCREELFELAASLKTERIEGIFQGVINAAQLIRRNVHAQLTLDTLITAVADQHALAEYNRACRR